MSTVSSELNALELDQVVGSALAAVIKAQGLAASQLADFIQNVGFATPAGGNPPAARTFAFTFNRSELDKSTGTMIQKQVTAEVPVLSILSLPAIAIDEATLDFELKIVAHDAGSPAASLAAAAAPLNKSVRGSKVAAPLLEAPVQAAKLFTVPARATLVRAADGSTTVDT